MLLEMLIFGVSLGVVLILGNLVSFTLYMNIVRETLQDKELLKNVIKNNIEITKEVMDELDMDI